MASALGGRRLLLVLDNCEHVIEAAARLAEAVLRADPHARVLATSREPLRAPGEYVYRVLSLEVPAEGTEDRDDLLDAAAVKLFVARARAVELRFSPDARTVAIHPEVILFDEPASALDPISTAKIEGLIDDLSEQYTIAIVTHNMQQAARVSEYTAFMYLGELIEFDRTRRIFTSPEKKQTQDYITGRFG